MAPKYILNYFQIAGRAEVARLMFHVAGVEFEDNQMTFPEWATAKSDSKSKLFVRMCIVIRTCSQLHTLKI